MFKILSIPKGFPQNILAEFKQLTVHEVGVIPREQMLEIIGQFDGIIAGDKLTYDAEFFDAAQRLKALSRFGVGVDNVDIRAAEERGIKVTNAAGVNAVSVAEHTIGLIIGANKNFITLDREIRRGNWPRSLGGGYELDGKILGQVGFGHIGSLVAQKCQAAFNMKVLVYDPYVAADRIMQKVHGEKVELDGLLEHSDVISLNLPHTPETTDMFDYETFRKMKNSVILVNTGRGDVIKEDDLARALEEGEIFAAGLDVMRTEPPGRNNPLYRHDRVIFTSHTAAKTSESRNRVLRAVLTDQWFVLQGKEPNFLCTSRS